MGMEVPDEDDLENNDQILSHTVSVGKHSFADCRQKYNKLAPPPKYLEGEKFLKHFELPV